MFFQFHPLLYSLTSKKHFSTSGHSIGIPSSIYFFMLLPSPGKLLLPICSWPSLGNSISCKCHSIYVTPLKWPLPLTLSQLWWNKPLTYAHSSCSLHISLLYQWHAAVSFVLHVNTSPLNCHMHAWRYLVSFALIVPYIAHLLTHGRQSEYIEQINKPVKKCLNK